MATITPRAGSSLAQRIQQSTQNILDGKQLIKTAIQSVNEEAVISDSPTFQELADNISGLSGGGAEITLNNYQLQEYGGIDDGSGFAFRVSDINGGQSFTINTPDGKFTNNFCDNISSDTISSDDNKFIYVKEENRAYKNVYFYNTSNFTCMYVQTYFYDFTLHTYTAIGTYRKIQMSFNGHPYYPKSSTLALFSGNLLTRFTIRNGQSTHETECFNIQTGTTTSVLSSLNNIYVSNYNDLYNYAFVFNPDTNKLYYILQNTSDYILKNLYQIDFNSNTKTQLNSNLNVQGQIVRGYSLPNNPNLGILCSSYMFTGIYRLDFNYATISILHQMEWTMDFSVISWPSFDSNDIYVYNTDEEEQQIIDGNTGSSKGTYIIRDDQGLGNLYPNTGNGGNYITSYLHCLTKDALYNLFGVPNYIQSWKIDFLPTKCYRIPLFSSSLDSVENPIQNSYNLNKEVEKYSDGTKYNANVDFEYPSDSVLVLINDNIISGKIKLQSTTLPS